MYDMCAEVEGELKGVWEREGKGREGKGGMEVWKRGWDGVG